MAFRTLAIGLSSAFGYVDNMNDEFYFERTTGTRPLSPSTSIVYYQPLPDVVSNNWQPNPLFQNSPVPHEEQLIRTDNTVSKIVAKLSSCFSRRRRRAGRDDGGSRSTDTRSSGPSESTSSEETLGQEADALQIAQRLSHHRDWCEDPRPEVDQSDNHTIGIQLRMISDEFQPSTENNGLLPRSNIPQIGVCVVLTLVISAISLRYCIR